LHGEAYSGSGRSQQRPRRVAAPDQNPEGSKNRRCAVARTVANEAKDLDGQHRVAVLLSTCLRLVGRYRSLDLRKASRRWDFSRRSGSRGRSRTGRSRSRLTSRAPLLATTALSRAGIQGLEPRTCACLQGDIPAACRSRTSLGVLPSRVYTARTLPRISPLAPLSLLAVPRGPMPEPQGLYRSLPRRLLALVCPSGVRQPRGRHLAVQDDRLPGPRRLAVSPSWGSCPLAVPTARSSPEGSER